MPSTTCLPGPLSQACGVLSFGQPAAIYIRSRSTWSPRRVACISASACCLILREFAGQRAGVAMSEREVE
jgi:hypothetical protein